MIAKSKRKARNKSKSFPACPAGLIPAFWYGRMSTDQQEEKSIASQRDECERWALEHGYCIIGYYFDEGESGNSETLRPSWLEMHEDIKTGAAAVLIVDHLDRYSRLKPLKAAVWFDKLADAKVKLAQVSQNSVSDLNDDNAMQWLFTLLQQKASHEELEKISGRVTRGRRRACKEGKEIKTPLYGVDRSYIDLETGKEAFRIPRLEKFRADRKRFSLRFVKAADGTWRIVLRIFKLYDSGLGTKAIAGLLNDEGIPAPRGGEWHFKTIGEILDNATYIGRLVTRRWVRAKYNPFHPDDEPTTDTGPDSKPSIKRTRQDEIGPKIHEQIVPDDLFYRVQEQLKTNSPGRQSYRGEYLISGLLRCPECGGPMSGRSKGKGRPNYYACSRMINQPGACPGVPPMKQEKAEELVLAGVLNAMRSQEMVNGRELDLITDDRIASDLIGARMNQKQTGPSTRGGLNKQRKSVERKITKVRQDIETAGESFAVAKSERLRNIVLAKIEKLEKQELELVAELEEVKAMLEECSPTAQDDYAEARREICRLDEIECPQEKRALLERVVKKIVLVPEKVSPQTVKIVAGSLLFKHGRECALLKHTTWSLLKLGHKETNSELYVSTCPSAEYAFFPGKTRKRRRRKPR